MRVLAESSVFSNADAPKTNLLLQGTNFFSFLSVVVVVFVAVVAILITCYNINITMCPHETVG